MAKRKSSETAEPDQQVDPEEQGLAPDPDPDVPPPIAGLMSMEGEGEGDPEPEPVDETVTAAAPLTPERLKQLEPADGHPDSSTNTAAAVVALRSPTGANHVRLTDMDGAAVDIEEVFEWPEQGAAKTTATVTKTVVEVFKYPMASTETSHILLVQGAEIPLWQARQIVDTYQATYVS